MLWTDPGYDTAIVGVPSGRAGWILARTPTLDPALRAQAEAVLAANGYRVSDLLETPQASD